MENFLAFANLQASFQVLCSISPLDTGNLLVIDHDTALLNQSSTLGLGGDEAAGSQQIQDSDFAGS